MVSFYGSSNIKSLNNRVLIMVAGKCFKKCLTNESLGIAFSMLFSLHLFEVNKSFHLKC